MTLLEIADRLQELQPFHTGIRALADACRAEAERASLAERRCLALGIEAGYLACERGENLQKALSVPYADPVQQGTEGEARSTGMNNTSSSPAQRGEG